MIDTFKKELKKDIEIHLKTDVYRYDKYLQYAPELFDCLVALSSLRPPSPLRIKIASVIGYFVTPFDLIPENLYGARGYIDDVCLTAYLLKDINKDNLAKCWKGDTDINILIDCILKDAPEIMLGEWDRLKGMLYNN